MRGNLGKIRLLICCVSICIPLILTSCTSMKNFRTSTQVDLEKAPYYHGRVFSQINTPGITIGHLPVILDRIADTPQIRDTWQTVLFELKYPLKFNNLYV